jgi:hypothetical protein
MTATSTLADQIAGQIAEDLADPDEVQRRHQPADWWRQSLANGALGVALLHVERARIGRADWRTAHAWLTFAAARPVDDGPGSHLHYGAPALAYVLHHASTAHPGSYARALDVLDAQIARATTARVDAAHRRIDTGRTPALCEFDAIRGLAGLGAYWRCRNPDSRHLRRILDYLVRLTEPLPTPDIDHGERPGWWTHLAPNGRRTPEFPNGHANNGLSHGIAGPLALLALAARCGQLVRGHVVAIQRILDWLDARAHRHSELRDSEHRDDDRVCWPYWTTTPNHSLQRSEDRRAGRPSWCYGAPGIARAQQLAGIALDDRARARAAETALLGAVTSSDLEARLDNQGLCHGIAGALLITRRAAADSTESHLGTQLAEQAERLHLLAADRAHLYGARTELGTQLGLLDGPAGTALALTSALDDAPTFRPGWDACLLTS